MPNKPENPETAAPPNIGWTPEKLRAVLDQATLAQPSRWQIPRNTPTLSHPENTAIPPQEASVTRPAPRAFSVGIFNDDLAAPINKPEFLDGGKSSQISLGYSQGIPTANQHYRAHYHVGLTHSIHTGFFEPKWRIIERGLYEENHPHPSRPDKMIDDGMQQPNYELLDVTGTFTTQNMLQDDAFVTRSLIGRAQGRVGYVLNGTPLQNAWHGHADAASYYRASNYLSSQMLAQIGGSVGYRHEYHSPTLYTSLEGHAGFLVGMGAQSAGIATSAAIGSRDARYLPVREQSLLHGAADASTLPDNISARPGTFKLEIFGKVTASGERDSFGNPEYRLRYAPDNRYAQQPVEQTFIAYRSAFPAEPLRVIRVQFADGTLMTVPQYELIKEEVARETVTLPPPMQYRILPLKFEGGISGTVQLGQNTTLQTTVTMRTNDISASQNPEYLAMMQTLRDKSYPAYQVRALSNLLPEGARIVDEAGNPLPMSGVGATSGTFKTAGPSIPVYQVFPSEVKLEEVEANYIPAPQPTPRVSLGMELKLIKKF